MAYRYGKDRNQVMLLPERVDRYVGENHPVRAYDAFVDALDFHELGIELNETRMGNSQYDPRAMLKLLLYGYSYGVKSSRKLERELHHNLSFIWLLKQLKPDHKTIAEFRRKNLKGLQKALGLCARLCLRLGLIEGNVLFVDSTKLRASAGMDQQHEKEWYEQKLEEVDGRIASLLSQCEQVDQSEAHCGSLVAMPKELAEQGRLKESIKAALAQFEERGTKTKNGKERQVNQTDPQSHLMYSHRGGLHPGYAMHAVVDEKNGLIVNTQVVSDANDSHQLAPQILEAEQVLGRECQAASGDSGYWNIEQIELIESDTRISVVPTPRQASRKAATPFEKSQFSYEPQSDCYVCPQGHRLILRRSDKRKKIYGIQDRTLCQSCPHQEQCTKSKNGRSIVRHVLEDLKERVCSRLEQCERSKQIYRQRKCRSEHPFGYIKKVLGFTQFSLKGREAAGAEASILATCFNLTRMINILGGVRGLVAAL